MELRQVRGRPDEGWGDTNRKSLGQKDIGLASHGEERGGGRSSFPESGRRENGEGEEETGCRRVEGKQ